MSFMLLGILNSQVDAGGGAAYELIESTILTSSAASVTFSSIPSGYKHLQIRAVAKNSTSTVYGQSLQMYLNGDSGTNYSNHALRGNGSSVSSVSVTGWPGMFFDDVINGSSTDGFGSVVMDILDYSSGSKNTTVRLLGGFYASSERVVNLYSGAWYNTAAVTSLTIFSSSNLFANSRFSLYGVKG